MADMYRVIRAAHIAGEHYPRGAIVDFLTAEEAHTLCERRIIQPLRGASRPHAATAESITHPRGRSKRAKTNQ